MLFDYWSPTDFKFAGIDDSTNKFEIGHVTNGVWSYDTWGSIPGGVKPDTFYNLLVDVNGLAVTVSVDGTTTLSYTFQPRQLCDPDGSNCAQVGLNKGLVGFGSNDARGILDNISVQTAPLGATLDTTEYFEDGTADAFTATTNPTTGDPNPATGTWTESGGREVSSPAAGTYALTTASYGATVDAISWVELDATVNTTGIGGIAFDAYGSNDFKLAVLDIAAQRIDVGHVDPYRGWVVETSFAAALTAGVDYVLHLALNETVATVSLNGNVLGSWTYNAAVSDGQVGLVAKTGTTSVDRFEFKTDDPSFTNPPQPPEIRAGDVSANEGNAGTTVVTMPLTLTTAPTAPASVAWTTVSGSGTATAGGSCSTGVDYITASGTATFAVGSTTPTSPITIQLCGDATSEPNETFTIQLSNPIGLNVADGFATVTIVNDDSNTTASVSVTATDANGAEQAQDPVVFTITRSGSTANAITVNLGWSGTATLTSDYTLTASGGTLNGTSSITLGAGVSSATITAKPVQDTTIEPTETVVLTVGSGTGYTVGAPASATASIADDDTPGVTVAATDTNGAEQGHDPIVFTITRTGNTSVSTTVNLAWGGMATLASDYTLSASGGTLNGSSTITLGVGVSSATITVTPVDDSIYEGTETVILTLASGTNYTVGQPSSATGSIADNETPPPTVTVAKTQDGSEAGQAPVVFTVSRTGSTTGTLAVGLTIGGTATQTTDYTVTVTGGTLSGSTLTFSAGSATATITIKPVDDTIYEGAETVTVTLGSGSGYALGTPSSATGSIADSEAPPTLSINSVSVTEGDKGTTNVTLTVTLSVASATTVTVNYATANGTALSGSDYQAKSGTLAFSPGVTTQTITIAIVNDKTKETPSVETFTVVLSSPGGATIGNGTGTVTITDNDGAMLAAEDPAAGAPPIERPLTTAALAPVLAEAEVMWRAVDPSADFGRYTIEIGDLPGPQLGWTDGRHTTIDATADGFGWSVMYPGSAGRMDLLTVVLHELGRALGLTTDDAGRYPVMAATLSPGERLALVDRAAPLVVAPVPRASAIELLGASAAPWISSLSGIRLATIQPGNRPHISTVRRHRR